MQVARLAGIPVRLHWSFGILVGFVALSSLVSQGIAGLATSLLTGAVLFGSVVLHELGHALAARAYGIATADITLYPFGGIASLRSMPRAPRAELVIALAGPLVNVALVVLSAALWLVFGGWLLTVVAGVNLVMALFNLIPAFPMDGGRVLRAALAERMGFVPASRLAIRIGKGFAWLFVIGGVVAFAPSLLLVGLFLHVALRVERQRLEWAASSVRWRPPRYA